MSIDFNDEIMQDFLVEAGEILEQLNEQLVDLEQSPDNSDLLNSIFRGFHTIKGGGSFLALTNLVEVCHKSEDVFNMLRNQELSLNSHIMDVFLRVLDEVNRMFEELRAAIDPAAAASDLLLSLENIQKGQFDLEIPEVEGESPIEDVPPEIPDAAVGESPVSFVKEPATVAGKDFVGGDKDITDDEFEALLDALQSNSPAGGISTNETFGQAEPPSDDISEDEFEALLDSLHGNKNSSAAIEPPTGDKSSKKSQSTPSSDDISDDEFENLLDNIHGQGKGPGTEDAAAKAPSEPDIVTSPPPAPDERQPVKQMAVSAPKVASQPPVKKQSQAESTVRVDTARLDDIMNLVGELVLARNRLNTLKDTFEDERVHKAISNLDVVTVDLQSAVMKTRMQPVKKVFGRFPRVVRDLARSLKKEVNLEMVGEETDLDKNLVEALADPLVHLVRNSVDHGIETPDVREMAGKPREGTVILAAQQEGDHILLSITDDGAGMDPEVLRNNAVKKGLMDAESASRLDDKDCFDLIFMPGLSTKDEISDVSGRGVGMDVVKTKITQLNGTIDISSEIGKGTQLKIKVPLTLAILPTLMVQLGSRKFALPLSNVNEIFELSSKKTSVVDGRKVVLNRGKAPPLFYLRNWLLNGSEPDEPQGDSPQVIMVQVAHSMVGLVVDQVIGQEEVVIKPLGAMLHGLPGLAGSTITGDGNIAIILDVQGLLKRYT
ncbi:MAG: two-component system chemotaxis sensor kinase CheA [Gammaproteobacteria bacterium]|jgi:two-component system chemotaxis sensor kinase CheA